MKTTVRVGDRGQVVIPKSLRDRYRLTPKTTIEFIEEKGSLIIRRLPASQSIQADAWNQVRGMLKSQVKDVDAEIEEMRGR